MNGRAHNTGIPENRNYRINNPDIRTRGNSYIVSAEDRYYLHEKGYTVFPRGDKNGYENKKLGILIMHMDGGHDVIRIDREEAYRCVEFTKSMKELHLIAEEIMKRKTFRAKKFFKNLSKRRKFKELLKKGGR